MYDSACGNEWVWLWTVSVDGVCGCVYIDKFTIAYCILSLITAEAIAIIHKEHK